MDQEWEGPCRRESKVQVFTFNDEHYQSECMRHCQKIRGSRSPPVLTAKQWENFKAEVDLITQDRVNLPWMWLTATKGDRNYKLHTLSHWPEQETVDNRTIDLEAKGKVWRDYYTGERLEDWSKPYYRQPSDKDDGQGTNCMLGLTQFPWEKSWFEWQCRYKDMGCPCTYQARPLLR